MAGLRAALDSLRQAGCRTAYVDGSFVTAKRVPADYDGCWELAGVDLARVDPVLLDLTPPRAAQKAKYLGELFPARLPNGLSGLTFLEFFQIGRDGEPKGIVALDLQR